MSPLTVLIVGGGAAGALAAIHLADAPGGFPGRLVVVEPAPTLGRGAAYGTRSPSHLLNVRASGMSAYPDDPGHFLAWARGEGVVADGTDFLPRMLYGDYLRATLRDRADHLRGRAVGLAPGSAAAWAITLDDGAIIGADHVILATGNVVVPFPGAPGHPRVVSDPWAPDAIDGLRATGDVLLVGSGLTAVDVALSLRDIGHRGHIRMVSSHGLLPEAHAAGPLSPVPPFVRPGDPASRTVRAALVAARAAAMEADDWRQVVDGIRPQTVALWRSLPAAEQRRFLRHLARRWDVRRHRMATGVAAAMEEMQVSGRLSVERGRLSRLEVVGERIQASIMSNGAQRLMDMDAVVLCVGPSADPRRDPFLAALLDAGIVTRHPLGLGLAVDVDGRVLAPDGDADRGLWAVGPLRKGAEWESTAVPEIRVHARDISQAILASSEAASDRPGAGA